VLQDTNYNLQPQHHQEIMTLSDMPRTSIMQRALQQQQQQQQSQPDGPHLGLPSLTQPPGSSPLSSPPLSSSAFWRSTAKQGASGGGPQGQLFHGAQASGQISSSSDARWPLERGMAVREALRALRALTRNVPAGRAVQAVGRLILHTTPK